LQAFQTQAKALWGRVEGSVEGQQFQDGQPMAQQHMEKQHCAAAQHYVPLPVHISCIAQGHVQHLQE